MTLAAADFAELIYKQINVLAETLKRNAPRHQSTIRVEIRVVWPKLGEDGGGGREVEELYEKFESIVIIANNGEEMPHEDMLIAFKSSLHSQLSILDL